MNKNVPFLTDYSHKHRPDYGYIHGRPDYENSHNRGYEYSSNNYDPSHNSGHKNSQNNDILSFHVPDAELDSYGDRK